MALAIGMAGMIVVLAIGVLAIGVLCAAAYTPGATDASNALAADDESEGC